MASKKIMEVFEHLEKEGIGGVHYYRGFIQFLEYSPQNPELSQRRLYQFISSTTTSYLAMTILALSNLLKDDAKAVSLNYLLNLFRIEKLFPEKRLAADEKFLQALREEAEPLLAARSKIFAHVDRKIVTDPVVIEKIWEGMVFEDIEAIYKRICSMMNTYGALLGRSWTDWELPTWTPELHELFILLDLGYTSRKSRLAAGIFTDKYPMDE